MPSELIFVFVGTLATLATIGYFMENLVADAKRALFGLAGSYLWGIWAFEANEIYVAQLTESPLSLQSLWYTGLVFSIIMLVLGAYRALTVISGGDGE